MNTVNTRPYHHGHLREALLDEALGVLRASGPDAVALREIARRAGVTPSAAYRHFASREALMAALGERVLEALGTRIEVEVASLVSTAGPRDRIRAAGHGYLDFAREEPQQFRLVASLDRPEASPFEREEDAEGAGASAGADPFARFRELVVAAIPARGAAPDADPGADADRRTDADDLATALWASVHGLAMLLSVGSLRGLPDARKAELATSCVDLALRMLPTSTPDGPCMLRAHT